MQLKIIDMWSNNAGLKKHVQVKHADIRGLLITSRLCFEVLSKKKFGLHSLDENHW